MSKVKFQRYTQRVRAVGAKVRDPLRRAACITFDNETFNQLAKRAHMQEISLAELIRNYCEWGLEQDTSNG